MNTPGTIQPLERFWSYSKRLEWKFRIFLIPSSRSKSFLSLIYGEERKWYLFFTWSSTDRINFYLPLSYDIDSKVFLCIGFLTWFSSYYLRSKNWIMLNHRVIVCFLRESWYSGYSLVSFLWEFRIKLLNIILWILKITLVLYWMKSKNIFSNCTFDDI